MTALTTTATPQLPFDSRCRWPNLLVSVALANEVDSALAGGAEIIDAKNPTAGALGRVSPLVLSEVVQRVAGRVPVTAAWGEFAELPRLNRSERESLRGVSLIKLGTAGFHRQAEWSQQFATFRGSLPSELALAVVHYADWSHCDALDFEQSLLLAIELKASALVIDTHGKQTGTLLDFYTPSQLGLVLQRICDQQLQPVLAGSLRIQHLEGLLECATCAPPPIVAGRGAACRDGRREAPICSDRVAGLRRAIDQLSIAPHVLTPVAQRLGISELSPPAAGR